MPDIGKVLKDEIRRLARKELRVATDVLRRDKFALKRAVAQLKRRVAQLERESRRLAAAASKRQAEAPSVAPEAGEKARLTSRTIRSLRRKMRLSQAEFAKLVGVSTFAVHRWEHRPGKLCLRRRTRLALLAVRGLGAREARARLNELAASKSAPSKRTRRRRGRK